MLTGEFIHRQFEFAEFNPVQSAAIPHVFADENIIVSSATATGKTAISEAAFSLNKTFSIYLSPLRSLCAQKHAEWSTDEQFSKKGVAIMTGDERSGEEDLLDAGIVVATIEAFDSRTRNPACKEWLQKASLLVVDEAHVIGEEERGDRLEAALMRFTAMNPQARLLLLSGTMSNAKWVAEWIKTLNGKPTVTVHSTWRPSKLKVAFHEFPASFLETIDLTASLVKDKPSGEKTIVFVHSKKLGKEICKRLKKDDVQCAFHNASLRHQKRQLIEQFFDSSVSGLDTVVSTSTLAAGINLG